LTADRRKNREEPYKREEQVTASGRLEEEDVDETGVV
jgi:hypothetical protein